MNSAEFDFDRLAAAMRFEFLADGLGTLVAAETAKSEAEVDASIANSFLINGTTIEQQVAALDRLVAAQSRIHSAAIDVRSAWSALQR